MSIRVVGYQEGRRLIEYEGPRTAQSIDNWRSDDPIAVEGGTLDFAGPGEVELQRIQQRAYMRRVREERRAS